MLIFPRATSERAVISPRSWEGRIKCNEALLQVGGRQETGKEDGWGFGGIGGYVGGVGGGREGAGGCIGL